jgi:serine/threonine protein kinase
MEAKLNACGYHITKQIGEGQVGSIYRARRLTKSPLVSAAKDVALKVTSMKAKGRREAAMLTKVCHHKNIVSLFDEIETDDRHVQVLQFGDEGNLLEFVCSRGRLDEQLVCRLWCELVDALIHAHGCGVCHRDVKLESMLGNFKKSYGFFSTTRFFH